MARMRHTTKPAANKSRSRTWSKGVSPSAPRARGSSNNEKTTARATTQDTNNPHRMRQVCSSRRRRIGCSPRVRAFASWLVKIWDSLDQRPPTSTKTHQSVFALGPTSSGQPSLFPTSSCLQCDSRCVCCSWSRRPVTAQCIHDCGLHSKLGSSKQRKPISHDP